MDAPALQERLDMGERLIFLVSAPRSGSTLLARMLGAHSQIAGGPEPHLLTPLAHLGYFERVDEAPYDPIISQEGIREVVARLPAGEADYVDACRAYTDHVYRRLLEAQTEKSRLLDKTPAYALVLPFLERLYPRARYVVLTRTPLAVLASFAASFFDGDYEIAVRHNPILERYVPAIARFLRESSAWRLHVRYEDLVTNPEDTLRKVCEFLELPFEEDAIHYGRHEPADAQTGSRGLGDPTGVGQHQRPVADSLGRWAEEIAADPTRRRIALACLDALDPRDLETWGYGREEILSELESARPGSVQRPQLTRYRLERKLLVLLRRNIHRNAFGRLVRRLRNLCDLLLR
jgi:hypothetical protein